MGNTITKVNPLQYITDVDPAAEAAMDASSWFQTETMSYKRGGWPPKGEDMLPWYLAQGWSAASSTSGVDYHGTNALGEPIAYYWSIYTLTRRRLQSERVLQDMITEFTDAYNEGRTINDSRYDELVTLWATLSGKVEDDINALNTNETNYVALLDAVVAQLPTDFDSYQDYVSDLLDGWGDSMRADLTERFDNLLAAARQDLVTRGMYNTTVWTSANVGIERERQVATTDLEDKILERLLASKDQEQRFLVDMRNGTLAAYSRVLGIRQDNVLRPLEVRNRILTSMFNFMERRQDDYPDLGNLANIAAQLGYSDTPSTVAAD